MRTRLLVRPQPQLRIVSTACSAGITVITLDEPTSLMRVGSVITVSFEGAEAVQGTVVSVEDDGLTFYTDIPCTAQSCPGGMLLATTDQPSNTYVTTSSGYVTYYVDGGAVITIGSGVPFDQLGPITLGPGQNLCFFPTGASGEPDGSVVEFVDSSAEVTVLDLSEMGSLQTLDVVAGRLVVPPDFCLCPLLTTLSLQEWPFDTIDISCLSLLTSFTAQFSQLESLDFSGNPGIFYVYCPEARLTSTDDTINSIPLSAPVNGTLDLSGGTSAPRTSASDTRYNQLVADGWTILTN